MIAAATASLKVISGAGAMIRDSTKTQITNTTPRDRTRWPSTASEPLPRARRHRTAQPVLRAAPCSTMNSRIIGTASRRLVAPVEVLRDESRRAVVNAMRRGDAEHDRADEGERQAAQPAEHGRGEGVDHEQRSSVALSDPPSNGVMRMPASAESEMPIIQLTSDDAIRPAHR